MAGHRPGSAEKRANFKSPVFPGKFLPCDDRRRGMWFPRSVVFPVRRILDPLSPRFNDQESFAANRVSKLIPVEFPIVEKALLEIPAFRTRRAAAVKFIHPDKMPRGVPCRHRLGLPHSGEWRRKQCRKQNERAHPKGMRLPAAELSRGFAAVMTAETVVDPPGSPCKLRAR